MLSCFFRRTNCLVSEQFTLLNAMYVRSNSLALDWSALVLYKESANNELILKLRWSYDLKRDSSSYSSEVEIFHSQVYRRLLTVKISLCKWKLINVSIHCVDFAGSFWRVEQRKRTFGFNFFLLPQQSSCGVDLLSPKLWQDCDQTIFSTQATTWTALFLASLVQLIR